MSVGSGLDWDRYAVVVFDVDGTLYDQGRLRRRMMVRLLMEAARTRDAGFLRIISAFRAIREDNAFTGPDLKSEQYAVTARRLGVDVEVVRSTVERWMEVAPLPLLPACACPGVHDVFSALRGSGRTVCAFSDFPVERKLAALGLEADIAVCATDPHVDRFKPHPRGLEVILERTGARPEACLMIGDRADRDGVAARSAGVDVLLRSRATPGYRTFRSYRDEPFAALLRHTGASSADAVGAISP
jgi:FMN phosphatase YigB (HAD superfamily)